MNQTFLKSLVLVGERTQLLSTIQGVHYSVTNPDYYYRTLDELFHPEQIAETLEEVDSPTRKQETILKYIAENPDAQFIELVNTFNIISDKFVVELAKQYGARSEHYDHYESLKEEFEN